jgi:hypothetical protein
MDANLAIELERMQVEWELKKQQCESHMTEVTAEYESRMVAVKARHKAEFDVPTLPYYSLNVAIRSVI